MTCIFAKLPSIHQYVILKTYEQGKINLTLPHQGCAQTDLPSSYIKPFTSEIFFLPETVNLSHESTKPRKRGLSVMEALVP